MILWILQHPLNYSIVRWNNLKVRLARARPLTLVLRYTQACTLTITFYEACISSPPVMREECAREGSETTSENRIALVSQRGGRFRGSLRPAKTGSLRRLSLDISYVPRIAAPRRCRAPRFARSTKTRFALVPNERREIFPALAYTGRVFLLGTKPRIANPGLPFIAGRLIIRSVVPRALLEYSNRLARISSKTVCGLQC